MKEQKKKEEAQDAAVHDKVTKQLEVLEDIVKRKDDKGDAIKKEPE